MIKYNKIFQSKLKVFVRSFEILFFSKTLEMFSNPSDIPILLFIFDLWRVYDIMIFD